MVHFSFSVCKVSSNRFHSDCVSASASLPGGPSKKVKNKSQLVAGFFPGNKSSLYISNRITVKFQSQLLGRPLI